MRAIVIGGSIAGLMFARVLSEHADHVIVLDRDTPGAHVDTGGDTQVHALLNSGRETVEQLFPGLFDDLEAGGGIGEGFGSALRGRVAALPNVEIRSGTVAVSLRVEDGRVTGVETRSVELGRQILDADVVIDASGHAAKAGRWLEDDGSDAPDGTIVDAKIARRPDSRRQGSVFEVEDDRLSFSQTLWRLFRPGPCTAAQLA